MLCLRGYSKKYWRFHFKNLKEADDKKDDRVRADAADVDFIEVSLKEELFYRDHEVCKRWKLSHKVLQIKRLYTTRLPSFL